MSQLDKVPEELDRIKGIFEERSKVYGRSTYGEMSGHMLLKLEEFCEGSWRIRTNHDSARARILRIMQDKLNRYSCAFNDGGHQDSLDDIAVYAMMLRCIDRSDKNPEAKVGKKPAFKIDPVKADDLKGGWYRISVAGEVIIKKGKWYIYYRPNIKGDNLDWMVSNSKDETERLERFESSQAAMTYCDMRDSSEQKEETNSITWLAMSQSSWVKVNIDGKECYQKNGWLIKPHNGTIYNWKVTNRGTKDPDIYFSTIDEAVKHCEREISVNRYANEDSDPEAERHMAKKCGDPYPDQWVTENVGGEVIHRKGEFSISYSPREFEKNEVTKYPWVLSRLNKKHKIEIDRFQELDHAMEHCDRKIEMGGMFE